MWLLFGRSPAVALVVLFALITVLSQLTTTAADLTEAEEFCREFVDDGKSVKGFVEEKRNHLRDICVNSYTKVQNGVVYGEESYCIFWSKTPTLFIKLMGPEPWDVDNAGYYTQEDWSGVPMALVSGESVVVTFVKKYDAVYTVVLLTEGGSEFNITKIVRVRVKDADFDAIFDELLLLDGSYIKSDLLSALKSAVKAWEDNRKIPHSITVEDV
eukprot:GHVS01005622.1.p1 GENE.GHVS01005622.1~~GHVS01005622.1.p1  ORF type:complete len:214 (+),score=15.90 GHVS01005622.1:102-743(+)